MINSHAQVFEVFFFICILCKF